MSVKDSFAPGLLSDSQRESFKQSYATSQPYRHAVINQLLSDDLLRRARAEIISELSFTEKQTDIYKVNQTGDLANLDGLPEEEKSKLQALWQVRNAMYSDEFRAWLESVTGCGALSAKKKDMSINDYTSGCHLLNHDDVISTRRVSYILYLPDPEDPWDPSWGGALELYPVKDKHVPAETPSVIIPPKWNQLAFFAVQPGHSFHAVEEVVHPTKSRLSISGWFHRPQSDEPGFDPADDEREEQARKDHASAEGLLSKEFDLPFHSWPEHIDPPLPGSELDAADKRFLSFFLNPAYLTARTQSILFNKFGDESHVLLAEFLKKDVAQAVEKGLSAKDKQAGLRWWEHGARSSVHPTSHQIGVDQRWQLSGPPHRQRFVALQQASGSSGPLTANPALPDSLPTDVDDVLSLIQTALLPSPAFRHFLANISQLVPMASRPISARRFRPGLDYTLARSDDEAVLDLTLDLTPDASAAAMKAAGATGSAPKGLAAKNKKAPPRANGESSNLTKAQAKKLKQAWETGITGGWEAYTPPVEEGDDPAVYGSGKQQQEEQDEEAEAPQEMDVEQDDEDEDVDMDGEEEEDDDGALLTLTPSFNNLSLVLRDEKVMRFVKYLSASAGGSRWDVSAEYQVGAAVSDDEQEEE